MTWNDARDGRDGRHPAGDPFAADRDPAPDTVEDDNIDFDRVVWDPDYRRAVRDRLNRTRR